MTSRLLVACVLAVAPLAAQQEQERPKIPSDSLEVTITGCLNKRVLVASDVRPLAAEDGLDDVLHEVGRAQRSDRGGKAGAAPPWASEPGERYAGADPAQALTEVGQDRHVTVAHRGVREPVNHHVEPPIHALREESGRLDLWSLHRLFNAHAR